MPGPEHHASVPVRLDRMSVQRDDARRVPFEAQAVDPRARSVDQPQADDARPRAPRTSPTTAPFTVTVLPMRPAWLASIALTKSPVMRRLAIESPIRKHPDQVAVDRRRIALLDDQRAVESAPDLLGAAEMRVVPEGAGVRQIEFVDGSARPSPRSAAASGAARRPSRSAGGCHASAPWSRHRARSRPRCAGARPAGSAAPVPAPCRCRPRRRWPDARRRQAIAARRPDEASRSAVERARCAAPMPSPHWQRGSRGDPSMLAVLVRVRSTVAAQLS